MTVPRFPQDPVETAPLPDVRVSTAAPAGAFGGLPGIDLTHAAGEIQQIIGRAQQEADETHVLDADNQLASVESTALNDPETGILQRKGKNALSAPEDARQLWQQRTSEIEQTLTTNRQRLAFRKMASARQVGFLETVQRHVAQQAAAYESDTFQTQIADAQGAAVKAEDPESREFALRKIEQLTTRWGERQGWDAGTIAARRDAAVSAAHVSIINDRLGAKDYTGARSYFDANHDEIVGQTPDGEQTVTKVGEAVKTGDVLRKAQLNADAYMAKPGATRTSTFEDAKALTDPLERRETEQELDTQWRRRAAATAEQYDAVTNNATTYVEANGQKPPANLWNQLRGEDQAKINDRLKQIASREKPTTDDSVYYDLTKLAATDPARFAHLNLALQQAYLSPEHFQYFSRLQGDALKGGGELLNGVQSRAQIVDRTLEQIGLGIDPKKAKEEKPVIAGIYRAVDTQVEQLQKRTEKPATSKDVQAIVDELTMQHLVESPGRLYGTNRRTARLYELTDRDTLLDQAKDIPARERPFLEQRLRQKGLTVTDDNLAAEYRAYLRSLVPHGY